MKLLLPSTLLLFVAITAVAQSSLTGSVRDAAGKVLPFASIALLSARDSSLVKGTISKQTGENEFANIRPGQYKLATSEYHSRSQPQDRATYRFEPRVVQITYNCSFGSQTVKAASRRATGSEEERDD